MRGMPEFVKANLVQNVFCLRARLYLLLVESA